MMTPLVVGVGKTVGFTPGFEARELSQSELAEAARLRHLFFVQEKRWVPEDPSTPGEERDSYDAHCIHLGAFQGGRLVAYFRMLPARAGVGFMFDGPLRPILNDEEHRSIVRERSVELSRRAVHPDLSPPEAIAAIETLFMFVYRIWLREGFEDLYIVQEPRTLPFFERIYGLRFSPVNQVPYRFPDGTLTVVAHSSAKDLLASLERSGRRQAYEAFARQGMTARAMTLA